jgi:hypothetical protein
MITNIWLKSQPNKKISYPECLPIVYKNGVEIHIRDNNGANVAIHLGIAVARVEFRP